MVLEESGQTEDDGCDCDGGDVAVSSLYRAESLRVQRSTHGDVAVDSQQNRQPRVDHAENIRAREQPRVQTAMNISVVGVVDEWSDIAQRTQQEDDKQCQRVGHGQRL